MQRTSLYLLLLLHINLASPTLRLTPFKAVPEIAALNFDGFNAKGLLSRRSRARLSHISTEAARRRHTPTRCSRIGSNHLLSQGFETDKCF